MTQKVEEIKWTPETLGRVLVDMGQRDYYQCNVCPVEDVCEEAIVMLPCVDVAIMLADLNERGIPAPEKEESS